MKLSFTAADEQFREEVADWLNDNLQGEFAKVRYRGGPGDEHHFVDERKAWERKLAEGRWTCIGWPEAWGGRAASIEQQVIFHEEYARAGGPGRMGHIGDTLTGPTLLAFGSEAQRPSICRPFETARHSGVRVTQNRVPAPTLRRFERALSLMKLQVSGR